MHSTKYVEGPEAINTDKLWEAFLSGNATAYGKIFKFYYEDLYNYGIKFCRQPELVRDCIQETFVEIGRRRQNLAKVQSVKAYLIVCLRRLLLQEVEERRKHHAVLDEQKQQEAFQLSPEELIIQGEISQNQRQNLKQALKTLPSRQKEVLFLRYFNGMSYKEIEQILSINYQSIRNHVYRATKRLQNMLETDEEFRLFYLNHSRVDSNIQ